MYVYIIVRAYGYHVIHFFFLSIFDMESIHSVVKSVLFFCPNSTHANEFKRIKTFSKKNNLIHAHIKFFI